MIRSRSVLTLFAVLESWFALFSGLLAWIGFVVSFPEVFGRVLAPAVCV